MAERVHKEMSVEEFLIWSLSQDERYELVDGMPVPLRAMSGASDAYDAIVVNIIAGLKDALRGTGCRPSTADKALRTSIKRVRRPDVTVECSAVDPKSYEAVNPVAVFEILSPTTRKNDRNEKLPEYLRHPALRTIVLIDPDVMDVLVYFRSDSGDWSHARLFEPDECVGVEGTHATLELRAIYDGIPIKE